jgi:hypothetical protein
MATSTKPSCRWVKMPGLIHDIAPAAEIVNRIAEEAERLLTDRVTRFIGN